MRAVRAAGRSWTAAAGGGGDEDAGEGVQLTEWERKGWTYHAKGKQLNI